MAGFYKHSICNRLSLINPLPFIPILLYKFKVFVHLNKKQKIINLQCNLFNYFTLNNINPLINRNYESTN